MIRKHRIGSLLVWGSALLPLLLWLLTELAEPRGRRFYSNADLVNAGQVAGLVGMAMLSIAFVLSSRARFLEDYFGGLDKMYRVHHRLGQTAFVLLLIHPVAHALRFVPDASAGPSSSCFQLMKNWPLISALMPSGAWCCS